ncbi:hypothetical protein DFH09DRAFT_357704 [Mycena vulgaris]|nr:hypothetical protein DFH09DRAFT_357704 [Mycena vulgaris]
MHSHRHSPRQSTLIGLLGRRRRHLIVEPRARRVPDERQEGLLGVPRRHSLLRAPQVLALPASSRGAARRLMCVFSFSFCDLLFSSVLHISPSLAPSSYFPHPPLAPLPLSAFARTSRSRAPPCSPFPLLPARDLVLGALTRSFSADLRVDGESHGCRAYDEQISPCAAMSINFVQWLRQSSGRSSADLTSPRVSSPS